MVLTRVEDGNNTLLAVTHSSCLDYTSAVFIMVARQTEQAINGSSRDDTEHLQRRECADSSIAVCVLFSTGMFFPLGSELRCLCSDSCY